MGFSMVCKCKDGKIVMCVVLASHRVRRDATCGDDMTSQDDNKFIQISIATGTRATGTALQGHVILGHFFSKKWLKFCDGMQ